MKNRKLHDEVYKQYIIQYEKIKRANKNALKMLIGDP